MFPQKELKSVARKKRTIVARSDLLRAECSQMWEAMGRRTRVVENGLNRLRWLPPVLSVASAAAVLYLKTRGGGKSRFLTPLLSIAGVALGEGVRRSSREPKPRRLPEPPL